MSNTYIRKTKAVQPKSDSVSSKNGDTYEQCDDRRRFFEHNQRV
jgi:hypothetical protein